MLKAPEIEEWLQAEIFRIYEHNSYGKYLGMEIVKLTPSEVAVSMKARKNLMNIFGGLHGGAITSLADMVMGLACASIGKRIVTLGMNINFIYAANLDATVIAYAKITHRDHTTVIAEFSVFDQDTDHLLAKGRGTFFIIGSIETHIPLPE
ncbi:MAG: PaaI family thioesterase [Peptococcaceae bacterium]|jgi:acyl-CoA thioesterase|nr:PaaI family thioesterase [Peptococcaceae bacterium]